MRKCFLISGLALAMAGCAAQEGQAPQVQVRDLSTSREAVTAGTYRVEPGDTLYGIAWRLDMDHRDLARLNDIGPPYQIQPGQQLRLSAGGEGSGNGRALSDNDDGGVVTTGLAGVQRTGDAQDGDLDWLLPDETAIERNRRLGARPGDQAEGASEGPGAEATGTAAVGSTGEGPGPVFDYDSPRADGTLSERDLAERRAIQAQQQETDETEVARQAAARERVVAQASAEAATQAEAETTREAVTPEPDAGTAVAGGTASSETSGRRYTPVAEVPWQWPVDGAVIGDFGQGQSITDGIDLAGQKGQPVRAAGPGIVVYAGSGVRGYGNLILLKHNDQFLSAYAHNDSLRVSENDVVEAGEVIATMGDSDAEEVRLHFEVRKDGQPLNPLELLPPR